MTNFLLFAGPDIESHCWALTSPVINSKRTNCPGLGQKRGICEELSTFMGGANQFREDILPNKAVQIREKYAKIIM